ncbi:MAG: glycogen/starch/alpha-glucan phosphorylase [Deltaproteobacteria bacterium]|nr:glycogen/starch/alpha-glucan phosphorylase [Deltaproteobacteria bacterium]
MTGVVPETPKVSRPLLTSEPELGNDVASLRADFLQKLFCMQGKFPRVSTQHDLYQALSYVIRDRILNRWVHSVSTYYERESRTVVYLSAEYLLGPQLDHNLAVLGLSDVVRRALEPLGIDVDQLVDLETEPALGNGGLGRLAACFMDSLATLGRPAIGYGIRYEFGIFEQAIKDGAQIERTDLWLRLGCPWALARPEITFSVGFGGSTQHYTDEHGEHRVLWAPARTVLGTPHDLPVLGYGTATANFLRLWQAIAPESLDLQAFNVGDYLRAVHEKIVSENITKVLYPNDDSPQGKRLRLEQEYFFVSCTLQDMIRIYRQRTSSLDRFHEKYAAQLNDTHPALAVPELMRLLVDVHGLSWDQAWHITTKTFGYTNHTLLPEALETWPLPLFQEVLPRHLEIIYEINHRLLAEVRTRWPEDEGRVRRMSIIDEDGERRVRMANLATVGSHSVNGVAKLHTQLLRDTVLSDFATLWPEKFTNVTNGVTPRRFMLLANPKLSTLITETLGDGWIRDLDQLRKLEPYAKDATFRKKWRQIKLANKVQLAHVLKSKGLVFDPEAMLDVQVKRIHEYKRQHLNLLHAIALYMRIKDGRPPAVPRTILFAGKAAPGYFMAKLMIRLVHGVGERINEDAEARKWLRVVFVPNFNVKNAGPVYAGADLSEQISTAGMEASGTGNMKLSLNGALTIGTLDGANVEIREAVGNDNFFLFGMTADEVVAARQRRENPRDHLSRDSELARAIELISSGFFSPAEPDLYRPLISKILDDDHFQVLSDFRAYIDCQAKVEKAWLNQDEWTERSILTTARMGYFSSDRAIKEYAERVWRTGAVTIERGNFEEVLRSPESRKGIPFRQR